jgi:hypothetical protein
MKMARNISGDVSQTNRGTLHMRKHTWFLFALLTCAVSAFGAELKGILVDADSAWQREAYVTADGHLAGGLITLYALTREHALSPDAQKAGYGVVTDDLKFYKFDKAGNLKAVAALKTSKKPSDLRVVVTGEVKGDAVTVANLTLLP